MATINKIPEGTDLMEMGKLWETLSCDYPDPVIGEALIIPLQCLSLCPAGLEDMVLSALVQEQVEGITPEAIALMSPKKMTVSFTDIQWIEISFHHTVTFLTMACSRCHACAKPKETVSADQ